MTKIFVTGSGKSIEIGQELGKGGEGTVYSVLANRHWVAKLYNDRHLPDRDKQAKLHFMATKADVELLRYTAWPQETLHKTANGPIVGFLMPNVSNRVPIHLLYSPAHRRQDYPKAAWDFLLLVARNTAAAFATIHHHGHVLGDVNQGNVLVGADGKVVLIDTDSFQISADDTTYLCKVGVAHFTPPELQEEASFDQAPRISNHDNFGLALLIFHLLFGGRHPYSGVPLRSDAGEALESDIRSFRYAYAHDGQRRGFKPPPKSIPISIVPDCIRTMFSLAFTENGAKGERPTAQQWVSALDGLRGKLRRCANTSMHVYPEHLNGCPWCELEKQGVVYFLNISVGMNLSEGSNFALAQIWATIEAVSSPPTITIPNIATITVTPTPLPHSITQGSVITVLRILIFCNVFWLLNVVPSAWPLVVGGAWWAWVAAGNLRGEEYKIERAKRQATQDAAKQEFEQIVARIRQEFNPDIFTIKKQGLAKLRDEYQYLPKREEAEISKLHATAENRQKHQFLERHFIDTAVIPGVGPAKKAALRSFGIETAADVTWNKVIAVKGFGDVLTRSVLEWRKVCECQFVFNPKLAVTEVDKNEVRSKIRARKRTLEISLNAGAVELQRLHQDLISKASALSPALQAASQKLAQAQADLNIY